MIAQFLSASLLGALFSAGLVLSFMTQPAKVVGFLDFFGTWDPTLMFVMMGAIAVHMPTRRLVLRRATPVMGNRFPAPANPRVDARLIGGAAIFGVGWGLAGYCPGPGIASLSVAAPAAWFVAAMVVGAGIYRLTVARVPQSDTMDPDQVDHDS
jgi:uncharacterized membrane protein YedE/YeeE